ncbi:FixH family protein [Marinobacter subterrani]|uniref:FixH family protein n=1 Tax=Marinobacter subterrani TaxID=1658765 RepID=UPI002351FBE9|nr:FixH family protein [Marinobacter subterrani]
MTDEAPVSPWYRQPWLWFLIMFPAASIVYCSIAITISMNMDNSLVTDDWSKQGRGINMSIARDEKAADLGMQAQIDFDERNVTINLSTDDGPADFPYLVLNLFHPTLADRDRTVQFRQVAPGKFVGQLHEDIKGRWYYDLRGPANEWRLKGETWLPSKSGITVKAAEYAQG